MDAVRFSQDVDTDSLERERRHSTSLSVRSSTDNEASNTVPFEFGLLNSHQTYEAYSAELPPDAAISKIACPDYVNFHLCKDLPGTSRIKIRLRTNESGPIAERLSMLVSYSTGEQHVLHVDFTALVMEAMKGTAMLRPSVHCVH